MSAPTSRVLVGSLWIASVAAAYLIGHSSSDPLPTSPAANSASGTAGAGRSSSDSTAGDGSAASNATLALSADQPGQVNVRSLIAKVRAEMGTAAGGMMNIRGMLKALMPLSDLNGAQLQEALAEVEASTREPQQKMMFYSLLLGQLAETDGPAAIAYVEKHLKSGTPFDGGVRASVLGSWANKDPDGAWRWFQSQTDKDLNSMQSQMTMRSLFTGMAARDLETAMTRLNSLGEQERTMAAMGIASSAGDDRSRQIMLNRIANLDPAIRNPMQQQIVQGWAMSDAEKAMEWVRKQPEEEQSNLRQSVGRMVMMADPERGAKLLLEGAPEKERSRVYDTVVGQWAYSDPRKAGEWLGKQPQGPELDSARRTFASVVVQRDPAAAMDWAKSVTDPEQRSQSVTQIYHMWRSKNAEQADAALDGSGLPPEKITELKDQAAKTTPPKNP